jgi:tRNA(Ile)-lysidine synthase
MAARKSSRSAERSQPGVHLADFLQSLAEFLDSRLTPGDRLCVALSGGRDSVVLLHALRELDLPGVYSVELSALHVHHGLSANADAWADFCTKLCAEWGIPLRLRRVDVPRNSGTGLEAAARALRHEAFAECGPVGANGKQWVALAHHRDDQAETVLLNLLRGAGVDGAGGMLAERPHGDAGVRLIRPLLDRPRSALEAYAASHRLLWIDDESNADTEFRRNYLRHEVMPRLAARFPGCDAALARAATHFSEGAGLLADLAEFDRLATAPGGRIEIARLKNLSTPRARNLLRHELRLAGCPAPDTRWIDEALRQLGSERAEAATCVSVGRHQLHAYRGEVHVVEIQPPAPEDPVFWAGERVLPWAGGVLRFSEVTGAGLSCALLAAGALRVARRSGGERLQLDSKRPRRALRNLLQEAGIPPWQRERLPFLWCGDALAWIGAVGMDCRFACAPGEPGLLVEWDLRVAEAVR